MQSTLLTLDPTPLYGRMDVQATVDEAACNGDVSRTTTLASGKVLGKRSTSRVCMTPNHQGYVVHSSASDSKVTAQNSLHSFGTKDDGPEDASHSTVQTRKDNRTTYAGSNWVPKNDEGIIQHSVQIGAAMVREPELVQCFGNSWSRFPHLYFAQRSSLGYMSARFAYLKCLQVRNHHNKQVEDRLIMLAPFLGVTGGSTQDNVESTLTKPYADGHTDTASDGLCNHQQVRRRQCPSEQGVHLVDISGNI